MALRAKLESHPLLGSVGRLGVAAAVAVAVAGCVASTRAFGCAGLLSGGFASTMALEGAGCAEGAGLLNRTISWEVLMSGLSCTTGAAVISAGSIFLPSIHEQKEKWKYGFQLRCRCRSECGSRRRGDRRRCQK